MSTVAELSALSGTILSVLMLAGFLLLAGGIWLLVKQPDSRKQGWLMLVAAIVMFANVAIWAVPVRG
ncbi:MAG: hypothetical protein E2598_08480 [Sphingobium sp.]|nr:hypothetical protein [Sphingobium sp.]